jgi:hypothetical protein
MSITRVSSRRALFGEGPARRKRTSSSSVPGTAFMRPKMLFTLMGTGCTEVTRTISEEAEVVTARWKDGRLGTMRVDRPYSKFGASAFRSKNHADIVSDIKVDYVPLVRQIVEFMNTRMPPVPDAETLEIFTFLDAAQKSKAKNGAPVSM